MEGVVLGGVTVVLATFSFVFGDVVCDLVGHGLLSLDAIVNLRLEPSEHLYYLVKIFKWIKETFVSVFEDYKASSLGTNYFQPLYLWLILTAMGLTKRIQSQPERPTQKCHNVMPVRIAGGHLQLEHTDETASSEAAGQCRIRQRKLSS